MAKIMLTNKSSRVFTTTQGRFYPETSKEFDEKDAIQLLGYSKEIVRTEDAIGPEFKKAVKEKDRKIKELEAKLAVATAKPKDAGEIGAVKQKIEVLTGRLEELEATASDLAKENQRLDKENTKLAKERDQLAEKLAKIKDKSPSR